MNVLFLMADELSWWALGHTGGIAHTPHLDRLAARARRFCAAYTPSPICVPTRAAIATGRYLHDIGYWSSAEAYDGLVPSWGHALKNAGLEPVSFGKLHYRSGEDDTGFSRQIAPVHVVDGIGWAQALLRRPVAPYGSADSLARDIGAGKTAYTAQDRAVTDAAVDWLHLPDRAREPWCAFVSWLAPHFPLIAPPADFARYRDYPFSGTPEPGPDHPVLRQIAGFFRHDEHFTPETRKIAKAAYFGLCTFLDRQVGRVLKALDAAGLAEDTLVIFTSDHGEMLGEKGFWTKSTMYDSAARVPLLMAGPGVEPGIWAAPVSLIDIAPTICTALAAEHGFPGIDLRAPDADRAVISEYHDGGAPVGITMLRWEHWKLVHYAEGNPPQLFDMRRDEGRETEDLAQTEPDILREGYRRLNAMFDTEAANARAHSDQAKRVLALGGKGAVLAREMFDYTPADSRKGKT